MLDRRDNASSGAYRAKKQKMRLNRRRFSNKRMAALIARLRQK
jgi:hypothetical protein